MSNPKLDANEVYSSAWKKTKALIETELTRARRALEQEQPESKTAQLRGQIKALNTILSIERPEQKPDLD